MTKTIHTYNLTEDQALLVFKVISSECSTLKNHVLSAVESEDFERAKKLAAEAREYLSLFACFNIQSNQDIAEFTGKPIETNHTPRRGPGL